NMAFHGGADTGGAVRQRLGGADDLGPFFDKKLPTLHPLDGRLGHLLFWGWCATASQRQAGEKDGSTEERPSVARSGRRFHGVHFQRRSEPINSQCYEKSLPIPGQGRRFNLSPSLLGGVKSLCMRIACDPLYAHSA